MANGKSNNSASAAPGHHPDGKLGLQAVVLADAAESRFRPFTLEKPRCLLPLVNIPLIEYTLEFLAVAGVEEIFVFCNSNAQQVRNYLADSKWSPKQRAIKIHILSAPSASTVGDVMRELDERGVIDRDFVLVSGNVISNMKFDHVLKQHYERREKNKDAIMTMVMKFASAGHRSRSRGEVPVIAIDPFNNECLSYDVVSAFPERRKISLETGLFKDHPALQIRNNLMDCQIDICSPEVLSLFTENFDYQDIRRDFVRGILTSDLYGKSIHVHCIEEEYAARVKSTQLYDAVAKDIIDRWTFPMVPDSNIHMGDNYRYFRGNVYKEKNVILASSSRIEHKVVIGTGSDIGAFSRLLCCTIGRNCKIGANVVIEGSYIWDNVTIESDCVIKDSIIADGVILKAFTTIQRGCLLSYGVIVGPNVSLPAFTKLSLMEPDVEEDLDYVCKPEFIGSEGRGNLWTPEWEDDEDEEDPNNIKIRQIGHLHHDVPSHSREEFVYSESESDYSEDEEDEMQRHLGEVEETVRRAIIEGHTVENAILELNALKMACNINIRDLPQAIIPVILSQLKDKDAKNFMKIGRAILPKWIELLKKFSTLESDKMECLTITLNYCREQGDQGPSIFDAAVQAYYFVDFIDDTDLFQQWEKQTAWPLEIVTYQTRIRKLIQQFIDAEETETESDEESSDEE